MNLNASWLELASLRMHCCMHTICFFLLDLLLRGGQGGALFGTMLVVVKGGGAMGVPGPPNFWNNR